MDGITVLDRPDDAHAALSPIRRQILALLDEPASASEVAQTLGVPRQRINYHMAVLERHGLVELIEQRQRRGFQERRMARRGSVILAPDLIDRRRHVRDAMSADAVVAAASDAIRAVGALADSDQPHPTATLRTDVTFGTPADLRRFLEAVADLAARFDRHDEATGACIRITLLAHEHEGEQR